MQHVHEKDLVRTRKKRRLRQKFNISSLPELDRVKWVQLQIDYVLHFFSSLEPMMSVDLDHLIIQLWQKVFEDLSGEPDALQVRAVSCHCVACLMQIGSPTTGKLDQ